MARKLVCDVCHGEALDNSENRPDWTFLSLAKLETPTSPFQRQEICPDCTTSIRRILQAQAPE